MIDRLLDALRALVREQLPRLTYLGVYEYTVQRATETTVDASPASTLSLPALTSVSLSPGILAQLVTPAATGARCRIRFVNGDPMRPICVGVDAAPVDATVDATGTLALGPSAAAVTLAGGSAPIARDGHAVTILLPPGALVGVLTPPGGAPAPAGTLTILSAMTGILVSTSRASA
jgi:hypothetical protein